MLLVLGRPGAGCSSFLRVVANIREIFLSVDGEVRYVNHLLLPINNKLNRIAMGGFHQRSSRGTEEKLFTLQKKIHTFPCLL